jgi:DNA-binding transcriptional regulator YhcF (GntR family)
MLPLAHYYRYTKRQQHSCLYLQIANAIIQGDEKGRIGPGIKLPGTRRDV